jgi:hypothetical protein
MKNYIIEFIRFDNDEIEQVKINSISLHEAALEFREIYKEPIIDIYEDFF